MEAESTSSSKAARSRAPHVNLFDMPELMPGAQPSANPAQREEFEQRCRQLHRDDEAEQHERTQQTRLAAGANVTAKELEAMFPALDADLVRALCADAPTPQHAIETLLALSAAAADPGTGEAPPRATTPPPRDMGVEDHERFPSLVDASGWQVGNQRLFDRDPDEDLGSAWRDRAKAAKDMPSPKATQDPPSVAARRRPAAKKEGYADDAPQEYPTDYEYRHRVGQRRAKHRAQYGRGSGKGGGRGRGAAPPGAGAAGSDEEEEEEEEEAFH